MAKEQLARCYVIIPLRGDFLLTSFFNAVNPLIRVSHYTCLTGHYYVLFAEYWRLLDKVRNGLPTVKYRL
jgi:hypothetical protein